MLRRILPGVLGWTVFLLTSALNIVVGVATQLLVLPFDRMRRTSLWVSHYIWGHGLWTFQPLWQLHRSGVEHVTRGPYLLVANHQSVLDIPAALTLPIPLRIMGKRSLFFVPLMGHYMRFSRQFAVPTNPTPSQAKRLTERITKNLNEGISVMIFPEGTRSVDGSLGKFQKGAFRLAIDTGVPVLPVAIRGTELILGKGAFWPSKSSWSQHVYLEVMRPVTPGEFTTARKMSHHVQEQIQAKLNDMDRERGVTIPWQLGHAPAQSLEVST